MVQVIGKNRPKKQKAELHETVLTLRFGSVTLNGERGDTMLELNNFYNMDCMDGMAQIPDKFFELAICDPPYFKGVAKSSFYGSSVSSIGVKRPQLSVETWDDEIPGIKYYKELLRVSKHQILWGCNYYDFIQPHGRLVWDKNNDTSTFSNCELASIDLIESVKIFRHTWNGMLQENMKQKEIRIHPSQKPIPLYEWQLNEFAQKGWKILDTHVGSASSLIACHNLGFDYMGFEKDKKTFLAATERLEAVKAQIRLF